MWINGDMTPSPHTFMNDILFATFRESTEKRCERARDAGTPKTGNRVSRAIGVMGASLTVWRG